MMMDEMKMEMREPEGIHPSEVACLLDKVPFDALMGIVKKMNDKGMGEINSVDDLHMAVDQMDTVKLELFKKKLLEKMEAIGMDKEEDYEDEDVDDKKARFMQLEKDMMKFARQKAY